MLSHEDTLELLRRASAGDAEAREALVRANAGLVRAVAARFRRGRGTNEEDVEQAGFLGLLKAIDGYDASFGVRFSTYAFHFIVGEIRRCLREGGPVRLSRSLMEAGSRVAQARCSLEARLGREPTVGEIAAETGLDMDRVIEAIESGQPLQALDACAEALSGAAAAESDDIIDRLALGSALESLHPHDRMLIFLRYVRGYTQSAVAERLGISQAQVSRHEKRALERLRRLMTA